MTTTTKTQDTREHSLIINGKPATPAEYNRIMNAKPRKERAVPQGDLNVNRGFSLMR